MGECILAGFGRGSSSSSGGMNFYTEIITANRRWTPPKGMKDNKCYVRIFGGGGAGLMNTYRERGVELKFLIAGGGGYMNYGEVTVNYGEQVPINIGIGGYTFDIYNTNGGTTYFGNYLSANGGEGGNYGIMGNGGNGGSGGVSYFLGYNGKTSYGGTGYQFGGGAGYAYGNTGTFGYGGNGGIWGGGGYAYGSNVAKGGNGGTYGGGGGGHGGAGVKGGRGGTYGGSGGSGSGRGGNGTNTSTWTNVDRIPAYVGADENHYMYLRGNGTGGKSGGGWGGFGGCGGNLAGGGGGYGGDGGSNGGGGGGYGGSGGSDIGGGGGYGPGAEGRYGGGGGFYTASMNGGGAAYGIYGHGGGRINLDFDSSNIGSSWVLGSDGVCIIQYWAP